MNRITLRTIGGGIDAGYALARQAAAAPTRDEYSVRFAAGETEQWSPNGVPLGPVFAAGEAAIRAADAELMLWDEPRSA